MRPSDPNSGARSRAERLARALSHGHIGISEIAEQLPALADHLDLFSESLRAAANEVRLFDDLAIDPEPGESRLWDRIATTLEPGVASEGEPAAKPAPATASGLPAGVEVYPVNVEGWRSYLVTLYANAVLPAHDHASDEVFVLLQGDVIERGGSELIPGDMIKHSVGTHHREQHSLAGCLAWVLLRETVPRG